MVSRNIHIWQLGYIESFTLQLKIDMAFQTADLSPLNVDEEENCYFCKFNCHCHASHVVYLHVAVLPSESAWDRGF